MFDLDAVLARVPEYGRFRTWTELREDARRLVHEHPGLARLEVVGASSEGRPIELLTVGHGRRRLLCVGAPHPNEPIGTLTVETLAAALCVDDALRAALDVTLYAIPVADPDGFVLNEGWFDGVFSPARYALNFYRPPHREQVEWSFPVVYKTLSFTTATPEAAALMRVMERVRPEVFYSLHNAGFCGVYFYASEPRPRLFAALRDLVARHGLPLHRGEPEVPYLEALAPAVFRLFGISDAYEYLARTLQRDPAPIIEAGTSSDDWLGRICRAFSFVCELPYYTAPALDDPTPTDRSRRDVVLEGLATSEGIHAEVARALRGSAHLPDDRLVRSVSEYVTKTPARLEAERAHVRASDFDRPATRAEACDALVCTPFHHMLYLGTMRRVALRDDPAIASRLRERVETVAERLVAESDMRSLPIRTLVSMQTGAGLLALTTQG